MNREPSTTAIPSTQWRGRLVHWSKRLLLYFLVICLALSMLQEYLIFPGAQWRGTTDAQVTPPAGAQLLDLTTADGVKVKALFGPALQRDGSADPQAATRPTLLYFYGNGMMLSVTTDLMQHFRSLGLNVLICDYVGYGLSDGKPSEKGCYASADAAYDWLQSSSFVDPSKIFLLGQSLGGAVACDLASRKPVAGLVMISSFTNLVAAAKLHYPFLPVNWLLKHRFESLEKIARVRCPVAFIHGGDDTLVPASMSQDLAAAAPNVVQYTRIVHAGHNGLFEVAGREIDAAIAAVIQSAESQASGPAVEAK